MKLRKIITSLLVAVFALLPVMEVVAQAVPEVPSLPSSPESPAEPDMPDASQDPDESEMPSMPDSPDAPDMPDAPGSPNDVSTSGDNDAPEGLLDVNFLCPAEGDLSLTLVLTNNGDFDIPFLWNDAGDADGNGVIEAHGEIQITVPLLPGNMQDVEIASDLIQNTIIAHFAGDNCTDNDGGNNGGGNGTSTATSTGTLVLMKHVVNENENGTTTATSSDFQLTVNGDGHAYTSTTVGNYMGTAMTLPVGDYKVVESTSTPYVFDVSYNAACSFGTFRINENATTTCLVTNTVTGTTTNNGGNNGTTTATGTLVLIKDVVNQFINGGTTTATSSDFEMVISKDGFSASGAGSSTGMIVTLDVGTYSLNEATSSQYLFTPAFSAVCANGTVTIVEGATTTCTITNTITGTTTPSSGGEVSNGDDDDNNGSSGRSGSRRRSSRSNNNNDGEVQGVSFGIGGDPGYCDAGINAYIRLGMVNDQSEVVKLQNFLNDELNLDLAVTGMYDIASYQAVNEFQLKYNDEILQPWVDIGWHESKNIPTGYFYKTTRWWANSLICNQTYPMPQLP